MSLDFQTLDYYHPFVTCMYLIAGIMSLALLIARLFKKLQIAAHGKVEIVATMAGSKQIICTLERVSTLYH